MVKRKTRSSILRRRISRKSLRKNRKTSKNRKTIKTRKTKGKTGGRYKHSHSNNLENDFLGKILKHINNNTPISELNEGKFYNFFNKHIDLPFSKEELENKVFKYKQTINFNFSEKDSNYYKKYYTELIKLKEELYHKTKKISYEDKLTELTKIIGELSDDLQKTFLPKTTMYGGSSFIPYTGENCPICMEAVNPNERFIIKHSDRRIHPDPFHVSCLQQAIVENRRCPMCREHMTSDDLVPATMIQTALRLIRNFYENNRISIMVIMGIIITLILLLVEGSPEFVVGSFKGLCIILFCILLLFLDILIIIYRVIFEIEGDYEAGGGRGRGVQGRIGRGETLAGIFCGEDGLLIE